MPRLVFHTFYGEFSGDTPEDIVQQLFEDSRRGLGPDLTMRAWWEYQRTLWKLIAGKKLPASPSKPRAAEALVACLVEVGALELGARPERFLRQSRSD